MLAMMSHTFGVDDELQAVTGASALEHKLHQKHAFLMQPTEESGGGTSLMLKSRSTRGAFQCEATNVKLFVLIEHHTVLSCPEQAQKSD